jgi:hypothetical protein
MIIPVPKQKAEENGSAFDEACQANVETEM